MIEAGVVKVRVSIGAPGVADGATEVPAAVTLKAAGFLAGKEK